MGMALRHEFASLKRCEKCHKARKILYSITIDGYGMMVCSGHCAEEARKNWQEKKDNNITPGSPPINNQPVELEEDNL